MKLRRPSGVGCMRLVMCEREIYLVRLYLRKGGWRITVLETMNFDTGRNWSLLAIGWDKQDGLEITAST
jgi:hypothetical protein